MNVTYPVADKIVARLKACDGAPVPVSDLLDLGTRASVKQALSRLARAGTIERVERGLYAWPRFSNLLKETVPPPVDELAKAWARKHGLKIVPSGAYAANLLGLSTQVPAKYIYYTNGRTQQVTLGAAKVKFLNRGPRTMDVRGKLAPLVFQAIKYLGKDGITPEVIARLRRVMNRRDRSDTVKSIDLAPVWMKPAIEEICREETH